MPFAPIEEAVEAIARGEFVVVVDDADRENEGDLIIAAEKITPQGIAFMVRHTSGVICLPVVGARLDELRIPLMVADNTESQRTAFTVSVDAKSGTSTGISATDRATTIKALIDRNTGPDDFNRPGHIFPLRYREGGVLKRAGHTEAGVDLARLAGLYPAAVLCEIVNDDASGTMARLPELEAFSAEHGLVMVSIADLVRYRRQREKLVRRVSEARIPSPFGDFTAYAYQSVIDGTEHIAMVRGEVAGAENVLVRVHSECLTGDVFASLRCDCGTQLQLAMQKIAEEGQGAVVYLRGHEGRGIGIAHKLRAYQLQEQGRDTVEANLELGFAADSHEYGIGAQILVDLGITTMRLLTNNPAKYGGLAGYNLEIVERVPLQSVPNIENIDYLKAKAAKLGHHLVFDTDAEELAALAAETAGNGHAHIDLTGGAGVSPGNEEPTMPTYEGRLDATGLRIALLASRFNETITKSLLDGALSALRRHGLDDASITVAWVPGAFELPMAARRLADSGEFDAIVCLGAVIRGATTHYDYVCGQAAAGIARVGLDTGVPVIFGVLTTENIEQAIERSGTKAGNKGFDSAVAAIEMADLLRQLPKGQ